MENTVGAAMQLRIGFAYGLFLTLALAGAVSRSAFADVNSLEQALVISKMTGACGMVKQMLAFQETTKMSGGEEFVMRFLTTETARLGQTPSEFLEQCKNFTDMYGKLTAGAKEVE